MQRDVVCAHIESGKSAEEQGVEDAFELLYEINERVRTGIWVGDCITPRGGLITVLVVR